MKSHTKYLWFNMKNRYEIINITDQVQGALDESKVKEGICLVKNENRYLSPIKQSSNFFASTLSHGQSQVAPGGTPKVPLST